MRPTSARLEREVELVSAGITAVSAIVLLASLFVAWYRYPAFCFAAGCPRPARSGWMVLGGGRWVLVVCACCGALPAVAVCARKWVRPACMLAGVAGLGAALLVVFRIAVVPDALPSVVYARLAGVFIALLGAGGIAGGAALAGLGSAMFAWARHAVPVLCAILAAAVVVIASLFMPWERRAPMFSEGRVRGAPSVVLTAWHAVPTGAVLLLLGALAIMLASSLVAVIRWRSSFFALAVGGWIAAALVVVTTALGTGSRTETSRLVGYYLCLAAAGVIVLAGIYGAIDAKEYPEPVATRGLSPRHE